MSPRRLTSIRLDRKVLILQSCLLGLAAMLLFPASGHAQSQITLTGSVAQNCTLSASASAGASTLNISDGAQHVQVGTVLQNCNKKAGYTVVVTSANCGTAPTGAKLVGTGATPDTLAYSVESDNPTTGGSSATVTGLLASVCTSQNARAVTGAKISAENSTIYVNYTGNSGLAADTYTDTLTFTMNVN